MADNPPNPPAQAAVPFALAPGLAVAGPLDFKDKNHIKMFDNATKALTPSFDSQAKSMHVFIGQIRDRSNLYGWSDILTIPVTRAGITQNFNLLDHYGEISVSDVRSHALTTWVNANDRNSQNSFMLFTLLKESLAPEALAIIQNMQEQYYVDGKPDGPSLFKVIISKAHVDTRATSTVIRMNLSSLDTYILKINCNISTFNEYVRAQVYALAARGEQTQDLLVNLFKAYFVVSDRAFKSYIEQHQNAYDDGENISYETLMSKAENKYKALVERDQWNEKSKEEEQIVALNAELKKLKLTSKFSKKDSKKNTDKKDYKKKGNKKKDVSWKTKAPTGKEPKTKKVDGDTWHWCHHHSRWVQHTPAECRLKDNKTSDAKPSDGKSKDKTVAFANMVEYETDSDEENQE